MDTQATVSVVVEKEAQSDYLQPQFQKSWDYV